MWLDILILATIFKTQYLNCSSRVCGVKCHSAVTLHPVRLNVCHHPGGVDSIGANAEPGECGQREVGGAVRISLPTNSFPQFNPELTSHAQFHQLYTFDSII